MTMNTLRRVIGTGAVLTVVAVLSATGAQAGTQDVPDDVAELLAGPVVEEIQASAADSERQATTNKPQSRALTELGADVPDFSGDVTTGPAHQVSYFTSDFLAGTTDAPPAEPTEQWLAALVRDGEAIGTARVWKPEGGAAELAVYDDDAVLGQSLLFEDDAVVIEDETISTFYRLDGDLLSPLPSGALPEFAEPLDIRDAQPVIAARYGNAVAESEEMSEAVNGADSPVGGFALDSPVWRPTVGLTTTGIVIGSLVALTGAAAGAVILLRHRRRATQH